MLHDRGGQLIRLGTVHPLGAAAASPGAPGGSPRPGSTSSRSPVASSPAQFAALLDGALDAVLTSPDNVLAYRYSPPTRSAGRPTCGSWRPSTAGWASRCTAGSASAELARRDVRRGRADLGLRVRDVRAGRVDRPRHRSDYEVVALGSTPKRLQPLLAGECAATMLNAGNELHAEEAGFRVLARAAEVCRAVPRHGPGRRPRTGRTSRRA